MGSTTSTSVARPVDTTTTTTTGITAITTEQAELHCDAVAGRYPPASGPVRRESSEPGFTNALKGGWWMPA